MISPPNNSNPIGFHKMAVKKSPLIKASIERVAPQEGQGNPVAFLKIQIGPTIPDNLPSMCMMSQEYPAVQKNRIKR